MRVAIVLAALSGYGCDDDPVGGADGGADGGGADAAAELARTCPVGGAGSYQVQPEFFLPPPTGTAVTGTVNVQAWPDGAVTTSQLGVAVAAAPGVHVAWATEPIRAASSPLVHDAYRPESTQKKLFCVTNGGASSVTIPYLLIPSSRKLWVGNALADASMLGFNPEAVAATGAPAATITARTGGSDGFAFDRMGNLWVLGGTTADPPLARIPANVLGSGGVKTPDIVVTSPAFAGGFPGPKVVALDARGDLWVSIVFAKKVVRFAAAAVAATGAPMPNLELTDIEGPSGLAFDATGTLYVSASGPQKIYRYDAAVGAATAPARALSLTVNSPAPVIGPLPDPEGLAFDAAGTLWANFGGTLVALSAADRMGSGEKTVTPAVQKRLTVSALPHGLAFDETGGLWVALDRGRFGRVPAAALAATGDVMPDIAISSADTGYAGWVALYPAPAGLGLRASLP